MRSFKLLLYSAVILAGILVSGYLAAQLFLPVTLEWDANDQKPEGYRLFRRFEGQGYDYTAPVYQGNKIRFVDECPAGKTCFWVVRAYEGENESGDSNEVSLTVPEGSLPDDCSGLKLTMEDGIMYLIGDPVSDGTDSLSEGTDYFEVELDGTITRSDGQRDGATGKIRLHHDLSGISEGGHTLRVRGVNDLGEGPWSVPFSFGVSLPGAVSGVGLSAE